MDNENNIIENKEIEKQEVSNIENVNPDLPTFAYNDEKTIDENANDLTELVANKEALKDQDFINEVATTKKEAIKESAKTNKDIHLAKKEAEKVSALNEIDKAFYEKWKLILTWGGVKEPVTKGLAIFLLFLILPFYTIVTVFITLPISIIKTLFGAINNLLEEISKFGKIARSIAFTVLIIGMLALIAYIILSLLNKYGIINIWN